MNNFEHDILLAIGKYNPSLLGVVDQLKVTKREFTGAGCFIDFEKIKKPIELHTQTLDLYGVIYLPNSTQLTAHIEMEAGIPLFLEISCLTKGGWEGDYNGYQINN